MTGSSRPNLPKNNREIGKLKSTHVQDRINSTSEPITSKNSTKQTYAEVVNGSSSFLDQLNEMKSLIQSLLIMQRQVMQCVFPQTDVVHNSKSGQTKLGSSSGATHAGKICPTPNSVVANQDYSCTTNKACPTYEFMLLNVARLLLSMSKDKSKIKFIGDLCSNNTLFVASCETFLSDVISDSEISITNFNIIRCDRHSQIGGGVCIYLKQSNSVCDLLIIKLIQPELIVILLYRPPSCSGPQFEDVILKMKSVMFKLVSPLPNIIMLGDFNLPTMSWSQPGDCFISRIFCPFVESLFLQQFVNVPTRKKYILDLVFCNSELIDGIDICDTFISDHCLLTVTTFIPVCFTKYYSIVNPPSSIFEMLNFKRCDWLSLQCALRDINWGALFSLVLRYLTLKIHEK